MFKAEEHRDCTDRPTRDGELTDRGLRAGGEGGPGRRSAGDPAGLFALLARRCSQPRAEKYKTTLLRIGTCHSINLSAADGAAGCCEPPSPPSATLSLSFPPRHALSPSPSFTLPSLVAVRPRTHALSLPPSLSLSLPSPPRSSYGPGGPASPTERAHTCGP